MRSATLQTLSMDGAELDGLRWLAGGSVDAHLVVNAAGRVLYANDSACRWLGYASGELCDASITAIDPMETEASVHRLIEAGGSVLRRTRYQRRDGRTLPVEVSYTAIALGECVCLHAVARPRSQQAGAESELRRQSAINQTLRDLALAFSTELDREALLQRIVDEATHLIGAEVGAFFFDRTADGERIAGSVVAGAGRQRFAALPPPCITPLLAATFRAERPVRRDDVRLDPRYGAAGGMPAGHPVVASYLAVPVRTTIVLGGLFFGHSEAGRFNEEHEQIVAGIAAHAAVALDNARLYESLRESQLRAEEANQHKDRFLALLGHELRNPLAPIVTAVEVARLSPASRQLGRELAVIDRQARHLARLVDDLMDVARIGRGKLHLDLRRITLSETIEQAVEMVSPLLEQKRHRLFVDTDPELALRADPVRLTQVFSNLLMNAAKFTEPEGSLSIRSQATDDGALVIFRDSGIGMERALVERLFQPFYQGDRPGNEGLGLGLALAQEIVALHGGTIVAHSEGTGRGSTFVVRLPLGEAHKRSSTRTRAEPLAESARRHVLLVDDNADSAGMLARALQSRGHRCSVASDAVAALRVLSREAPDVALVDVHLPVMNGLELCERIRALPELEGLRIVLVSGYFTSAEEGERAKSLRIAHCLTKPVDVAALLDWIEVAPAETGTG